MKIVIIPIILGFMFLSCVKNKNYKTPQAETIFQPSKPSPNRGGHTVEIKDILQTSKYTYLYVTENNEENWIAVTKQDATIGDVYYYEMALQMNDFKSKELNRTFELVYFVSTLSKDPLMVGQKTAVMQHSGKVQSEKRKDIKVEKQKGTITLAELFKNKKKYSGQNVKIRGVVVKVNKSIMGRNWIHIQDGTKAKEYFDLTVTSQEIADIDQTVTFEGAITLDKNFGSGYFYDVIMEDGKIISKLN